MNRVATATEPQILDWAALGEAERSAVLERPAPAAGDLGAEVAEIVAAVRDRGDAALRRFSQRLDGVALRDLEVSPDAIESAHPRLEPDLLLAMDSAAARIRAFHQAGIPGPLTVETAQGLQCGARYLPISPVGLYVPGGSAPLVSTVLMLAIPASLAGCGEIVLCTPPGPDGSVHPAILAAAARCGVQRVFRCGGAHAIAAMAFGTRTIPACAKLFGPGNAWVTEAKRQVTSVPGGPAQDLPAGPSELLVIADDTADAEAVAWDLLSQAEHGPDSQVLLLSDSLRLLRAVAGKLPRLAGSLPRADILREALGHLRLVEVESLDQAIGISNAYAPEHLILNFTGADRALDGVTAAGSVFVGPWTPESLGDYCSGTNHVLPTSGGARAYGGLSVSDFMRRMTVQTATPQGLARAGPDAIALARAEGLDAHRMAVEYRLRSAGKP